jgi:iron complex transport system substrate-binding protein
MLTDGYWFVPGGESYMAKIIEDAGGDYPWSTDTHNGSLQLDFSTVYAKAADADFWLVKSYGHDITLSDIESMSHLNGQFKAFKDGNVFVANTAVVPLYEEFPFHPEKLLEEYIKIFHPEIITGETRYYKRANEK